MLMPVKFAAVLLLGGVLVSCAPAQTDMDGQPNVGAILQRHYDAAQNFQQQGNLAQAAAEYRLLIGDSLAELALGESNLGQYTKAAPYFDGALALEPNSPEIRLAYARAAMEAGDLDHAQTLARQLLIEEVGNPKGLAAAHEVLGGTLLKMNEDPQARQQLEAAVGLDPSFDNAYNLAVACLDMDDEKCADKLFTGMEATYGDTPALHLQFGLAWGQSDFGPRAEEEFKKVIAEDPKFPEAHYCLAATYRDEHETGNAPLVEKELKEDLAITPGDFLAWAALGKLAASQQNYAAAAKYLGQAIRLNPRNPDAWLYQGQMDYGLKQWAAAEKSLRQAILLTTDPSRNRYQIRDAHYLLGRILTREGKVQEAAAQMGMVQKYIESNYARDRAELSGMQGQNVQGMDGSPITLALKDVGVNVDPAAIKRIADMQKRLAPMIADSYNNLGVIATTNRDFSSASANFASAAKWNPTMPGLNLNWGRAAFAAGEFSTAIMPLASHLREHPDDAHMRGVLGISQFMAQDYQECVTTLRPLAGQMDSTPQVAFMYADALVKTGQTGPGIERLTALEKAYPEIGSLPLALGEAYLAVGRKQIAVEELRTAVRLGPQNSEAHYELGEGLLAVGNARDAVPELESAVHIVPGNPDYHRELSRAYQLDDQSVDAERETRVWQSLQPAPPVGSVKTSAPPAGSSGPSSPN
jgi:tetratricopeptide (TPR) repeat protein